MTKRSEREDSVGQARCVGGPARPQMGVWIDRRQAVLVRLDHGEASAVFMESNVDDPDRPRGGPAERHSKGRGDLVSENKTQARWRQGLSRYIKQVARKLGEAERIYIAGPGRAKQELFKELVLLGHGDRIVKIDTADRMTHKQLTARVKSVFHIGDPGARPPRRDQGLTANTDRPGHRREALSARSDVAAWDEAAEDA